MKNPKKYLRGFFGGVSRKRRVWGGNPNKYLTGGQMSEKRNLVHWSILALRNCRFPLRLTLRQSAGGGLACFRQYSDCGGVSCPLWFCFLLRTEMENAKRSLGFLHHYYGSPIPFFQMAAVFFSSLLRYARPFWANFPVTFYNNRNVRSAKNGRKKTPRTFKKSVALQLGRYSIFISIM